MTNFILVPVLILLGVWFLYLSFFDKSEPKDKLFATYQNITTFIGGIFFIIISILLVCSK